MAHRAALPLPTGDAGERRLSFSNPGGETETETEPGLRDYDSALFPAWQPPFHEYEAPPNDPSGIFMTSNPLYGTDVSRRKLLMNAMYNPMFQSPEGFEVGPEATSRSNAGLLKPKKNHGVFSRRGVLLGALLLLLLLGIVRRGLWHLSCKPLLKANAAHVRRSWASPWACNAKTRVPPTRWGPRAAFSKAPPTTVTQLNQQQHQQRQWQHQHQQPQ